MGFLNLFSWVFSGSGGSGGGNAFGVVQPISGTSPTASAASDTVTLVSGDGSVTIAGNAATKTLDIRSVTPGTPGITLGSISATLPLSYSLGFLTLDGLTSYGLPNYFAGANGAGTGWEYKGLTGTAGQIGVTFPAAGAAQIYSLGSGTGVTYALGVKAISSAYTMTSSDTGLMVNANSGGFGVSLPPVTGCSGIPFYIQKTDTTINPVTLIGTGVSTTLDTFKESVMIVSDGATFQLITRSYNPAPLLFTMQIDATGTAANAFTAAVTNAAYWTREHNGMLIQWTLNQTGSGTTGTGDYRFKIPFGSTLTIDPSRISIGATAGTGVCGPAMAHQAGNITRTCGFVFPYDSNHIAVGVNGVAAVMGQALIPLGSASNTQISLTARIPITGWN